MLNKSNRSNVALRGRDFFLALACALLLAGCDGSGAGGETEGVDAEVEAGGLGRTDSGAAYCSVPSPTGDAVNSGTGRTARQEVALELETSSFMAFVVVSNAADAPKTCGYVPGASCSSPERDFAGKDGRGHCWELAGQDGEACRPSVDGKRTCVLLRLGDLDEGAPKPRATAVCSTEGRFVGWWCNNGPS